MGGLDAWDGWIVILFARFVFYGEGVCVVTTLLFFLPGPFPATWDLGRLGVIEHGWDRGLGLGGIGRGEGMHGIEG